MSRRRIAPSNKQLAEEAGRHGQRVTKGIRLHRAGRIRGTVIPSSVEQMECAQLVICNWSSGFGCGAVIVNISRTYHRS